MTVGLQTAALAFGCALLQGGSRAALAAAALATAFSIHWLVFGAPPARLLAALQAVSSALATVSLIPQILLNYRERATRWSPVTAGLSVLGAATRVLTTLQLTKDALLLCGFLAGFVLNAVLLAQILLY